MRSPSCPTPVAPRPHHAPSRVLAETAVTAVGGGEVIAMRPVSPTGRVWSATVVDDGHIAEVRLDTHLRTATVVPRTHAPLSVAA